MKMSSCNKCGMPIIWLKTQRDKNIPVDPVNVDSEYETFDREKHTCHFDTCPERVGDNGQTQQRKTQDSLVLTPFLQGKLVEYVNAVKAKDPDRKKKGMHFLDLVEQAYDKPPPQPKPQPPAQDDFDDDIPF